MNPKDYFNHKTLCSLPWIGIFVNPDGTVKNCSISGQPLGNLHSESLENIVNGETNIKIKTDMLDNIQHPRCSACYNVESQSGSTIMNNTSNRSWYKKYGIKNINLNLYDNPTNFNLKLLDLRWQNTCNQACVYCGPDLSSKWADELNITDYTISKEILEKNKKYIFSKLHQIDHVYLAGGEPLLINENLELLDLLYEINPNVEIRINTNLSIVNNKIFNKLLLFKNVKWTVSVDACNDEYEYIRYPGNWKKFYNNLISLKDYKFDINFNMVWCILNSESIFDCIQLLEDLGFQENTFIIQALDFPKELDVRNLESKRLDQLQTLIKDKLDKTNPSYWLHKSLKLMYNYIDVTNRIEGNIDSTFNFLNEIDQRRQLNSRNIFKTLYNS